MNHRELDILLRRERLRERIRLQRNDLARYAAPLANTLALGDRVVGAVRYARDHLTYLAGGVLLVLLLRPRAVIALGRRGFILWRFWRIVRKHVVDTLAVRVAAKVLRPYDRSP